MYTDYTGFNSEKLKCRICDVGKCYDRVILSTGNTINPTYMVIGEAPGRDEVEAGEPFVGKSGKILREQLVKNGLTKTNTVITNTLPCRPKDNVFPSDKNLVNHCINMWLLEEIILLKPRFILLVGSTPTKYLLRCPEISKVRGQVFDHLDVKNDVMDNEFRDRYNIWVKCIPTYHPAYVSRHANSELGKIIKVQFEQDIEKFAKLPENVFFPA